MPKRDPTAERARQRGVKARERAAKLAADPLGYRAAQAEKHRKYRAKIRTQNQVNLLDGPLKGYLTTIFDEGDPINE